MSTRFAKSVLSVLFSMMFMACSLLTPTSSPNTADIEKEEQAVYAFFLRGTDGTAVLLQETAVNISEDDIQQTLDYIQSSLADISKETLNSFGERNKQSGILSPNMDLGVKYVLLTKDELAAITSQPNWGEILNEKYPNSGGYKVFSRVGFNNALDEAVIYVAYLQGPMMGGGFYYLMEKKSGEWDIKDQIMVWIS